MKSVTWAAVGAAGLLGLAGCFTVSETEFVGVQWPAPAATNVTVTVRGFAATVMDVAYVGGWTTVYVPGYVGRYHWHPGGYEVVNTTTAVPQVRATDAYLAQAKDRIEQAGFGIMATTPDYIVEGEFSALYPGGDDRSWRFLWNLLSAFTYDRARATWRGTLKIYDNRSGRLVLRHEYDQPREVAVFSPIPLFGITNYRETDPEYLKAWCFAALTDRMAADAAAYLASCRPAAK